LPRLEVNPGRCRRGLPVGIFRNLGDVVAGVFRRITTDGIVVENTNYLSHDATPHALDSGREASIRRHMRANRATTLLARSLLNRIKEWSDSVLASPLRFLVPARRRRHACWEAGNNRV